MKANAATISLLLALAVLSCSVCAPLCARADGAKRITLFLTDTDWPPYVTKDSGRPEGGVFAEVLRAVAEPMGYRVQVVFLPDRRGWEMLNQGAVDVHVKAREWVPNPGRYRWSVPFLPNEDVLLYSASHPLEYTSPRALYGKSVAAIRGFVYPAFEPHFGPGRITRVDVATPFAMFDLLELDRVDAALVNRAETQWMLTHSPGIDPARFRLDKRNVGSAQYRFVFSPKGDWQPFIDRLDRGLETLKQDGRLEAILDGYR
ncbi:MAG: transporter substrate-binding domain-containing protein [Pseudodesulfovibrio sp.]